jgi:hypothetical protein
MTVWRTDPDLAGRFHPDYPDDIQVVAHEGSFRFTQARPEIVWARIGLMIEGKFEDGSVFRYYKAHLLNQPHQLKTLTVGQEILFMAHKSYRYGILVTYDYLQDRPQYIITPCNKCGLPEVFDPISKLYQHSFPDIKNNPDLPADTMSLFTSFCPVCGPNAFLIIRDKRIGEDKIEGMMSQAQDHIQSEMAAKPPTPTNTQTSTGYSASKAQEPVVNEDLFKTLKKRFGKQ